MSDDKMNIDQENELRLQEESGISDQDRDEILREIDKVVEDTKIPITGKLFEITPAKRGIFFPLLINLFAVAAIVGGFFLASWYFEQQKESLGEEAAEFLSAEGRLIAELKRETESKLQEKEDEIGEIQTQLQQIEQERADLLQNMDATIQQREDELKKALERQIVLERTRLEALGRSDEDITKQLRDLEEKVKNEQAAELNDFRMQAEAAISEKESELERSRALTERILEEARDEKELLEERSKAREQELVDQYEEEKAQLEERTTEVELRLQEVTAFQTREKLVSDQIVGTYDLIQSRMIAGNFTDARADLQQLRTLLYDPSISSMPNVAGRREADLFIIDSLEELLETRAAVEETKTTDSILEAANLLTTARGAVARADEAFSEGESVEAKRLYLDALKLVPSLSRAYGNLSAIESEESREILAKALDRGTELLGDNDVAGAVDAFTQAVVSVAGENRALTTRVVEGIQDTLLSDMNGKISVERGVADQLRSEIAALEQTNRENRTAIDRLTAALTDEQGKVSDLAGELEGAKTNNSALSSQNEKLKSDLSAEKETVASLSATIVERDSSIEELNGEIATLTTANVELSGEIASLETTIEVKDAEIKSVTAALATTKASETTLTEEISKLSDSLDATEANAAEAAEAAAKDAAEAAARIAALETDLEQLAEDEALLETKLAESRSAVSTLDEGLQRSEARVAELTVDLSNTQAAHEKTKGDLESRIAADEQTILSLREDLTEADNTISQLEERIEEQRAAAASVAEDTASEDATVSAETADLELAALRADYDRYKMSLTPLLGSTDHDKINNARDILSVFFERVNDRAFPGIYSTWKQADDAYIALERELAAESGRKNALNEVIRYIDFLSPGAGSDIAGVAFDALAQRDLLYKRTFNKISDIAHHGLGGAAAGPKLTLIGSVSDYAFGRLHATVFAGTAAAVDATVLIKRAGTDGEETTVAQGVVSAVEGSELEVDLRLYLDPSMPMPEDLVYLETSN